MNITNNYWESLKNQFITLIAQLSQKKCSCINEVNTNAKLSTADQMI